MEAEATLPARGARTVPVLTTALRRRVKERVPSHRACARSATPDTCGAAMEVPLIYTYPLLTMVLAILPPGAAI
jgi:hypothetical protein